MHKNVPRVVNIQLELNGFSSIFNGLLFRDTYKGTPLLLLYGGFGSIKDYKNVIGPLSIKYKVIALDSPGQGRSEQIDSISYQIYVNYYAEFIDQMKLDGVYILGWFDGGNTAYILAYDRPDKVKKVIVSRVKMNFFHICWVNN